MGLRYISTPDSLKRQITDKSGKITQEDQIMDIWNSHEDESIFSDSYSNLSPEKKADIDLSAETAMEEMYSWDKHYNPDIVGDMSFEQYMSDINPVLVIQRTNINKNGKFDSEGHLKKGTYLGTANDITNNLSSQEFVKELKGALKKYGGNVDKMKQSIKTLKETKNYQASGKAANDSIKEQKSTMFNDAFDSMLKSGG